MPPKVKVSKEEIVNAAVEIVRKYGPTALNARTVAAGLECSTQPVFSNFRTMEELHLAVRMKAEEASRVYMQREMSCGEFPPYKAYGMAYIRFAKEERELFKLLYMYDRDGEEVPEEAELFDEMKGVVTCITGLKPDTAKLFHLEMWAFVHGIATMFATGYLDLDWTLVSAMLTDVYQGLRKQYGREDENGSHQN